MSVVEEERKYQKKARECREKYGRCPAQREFNGDFYCSRLIPCDEYVVDEMIIVQEPGSRETGLYSKCRFVEKEEQLLIDPLNLEQPQLLLECREKKYHHR